MIKIISFLISAFVFTLASSSVLAQKAPRPINTGDPPSIQNLMDLFANIIFQVVVLAGFAAFLMLLAGGFRFLFAQGDPKATASARGMITWAIVGLAFVVFAWLILSFLADFTGLPLTTFCLPGGPSGDCPGLEF